MFSNMKWLPRKNEFKYLQINLICKPSLVLYYNCRFLDWYFCGATDCHRDVIFPELEKGFVLNRLLFFSWDNWLWICITLKIICQVEKLMPVCFELCSNVVRNIQWGFVIVFLSPGSFYFYKRTILGGH